LTFALSFARPTLLVGALVVAIIAVLTRGRGPRTGSEP
jgi:hypothetical protein